MKPKRSVANTVFNLSWLAFVTWASTHEFLIHSWEWGVGWAGSGALVIWYTFREWPKPKKEDGPEDLDKTKELKNTWNNKFND